MTRGDPHAGLRLSQLWAIDVAKMSRDGMLLRGRSGIIKRGLSDIGFSITTEGLRLKYVHSRGDTSTRVEELISIEETPVHFGGTRKWFRCPGCSRRCRIIYGGAYFRCRTCSGAHYDSQYEEIGLRISHRRWRIRVLLEKRGGARWTAGLDDGFPEKPPRMHWRTYARLERLDQVLRRAWLSAMGAYLDRVRDPNWLRLRSETPSAHQQKSRERQASASKERKENKQAAPVLPSKRR